MTEQNLLQQYDEAVEAIRQSNASGQRLQPRVGLVLGSGLSPLADSIEAASVFPYQDLPHFPTSTVKGHAGRLVIGELGGVTVCAMQGRFHFYEGYTTHQITFPIRVMARLGIETILLTNAAGAVNQNFQAGDLMLIEDHINLPGMTGNSPLHGPNMEGLGPRFPSMTDVYSKRLRQYAIEAAAEEGLTLRRGVYAALSGPAFETPAEVRFLRAMGADAVGMSTAPEAVVARHAGLEVFGVSSITNVAVDRIDTDAVTTHEEVLTTGEVIVPRLTALLMNMLEKLASGVD